MRLGSPELIQKSGDAVSRVFAKDGYIKDRLRSLWRDGSKLRTKEGRREQRLLARAQMAG
jgi:hypothetical protein